MLLPTRKWLYNWSEALPWLPKMENEKQTFASHINSVPLLPSSGLKIRCPSKVLSSCKYDRCSSKMYETEQYFSPQTFPFPKGEELKLVLLYLSVVLKGESWGGCQQTQSLEMPLEKTWHGVRTRMFMEMNAISHCWRRHEQNSSGSLAHPLQAFGKEKE